MPRAATKKILLEMANEGFDKLWKIIDSMSNNEENDNFCFDAEACGNELHWKRDKNLRDVLIHLYEWHQLFLEWEQSNEKGINKSFLPEPYNWKTYGQMNMVFWEKHQSTPLAEAKTIIKDSHNKVLAIVNKYTDEQLFTKSFYKWTGTSSLGQYCISTTISHYDWAIKKLTKQVKACRV